MKPSETPDVNVPSATEAAVMLTAALGQIEFARQSTLQLLDATPRELWFRMPAGLPTHIAWQIGHLTVSQYGLLMFRIRGRHESDLELVPGRFRKAYGRESVPSKDAATQPTPAEFLARLAQVHDAALAELRHVAHDVLVEPVELPFAAFPIKLGAILFSPLHELLHAGQIGLIRRACGLPPVR